MKPAFVEAVAAGPAEPNPGNGILIDATSDKFVTEAHPDLFFT